VCVRVCVCVRARARACACMKKDVYTSETRDRDSPINQSIALRWSQQIQHRDDPSSTSLGGVCSGGGRERVHFEHLL
jgi:hypothetical protein